MRIGRKTILIFLFMLVAGFMFIWTSAFSGSVEEEGLWILNESLSTEGYAVYTNGSQQRAVFSGNYDKYRLENGSLADTDYNINNFKVEKSKFVVELGSKTPSVNFTFKSNSLRFKFIGWGLYDPVDDDFWLSQEYNDITPVVDGNKIFYDQIVENISVSYEINQTGANKLITFTQKSRDSLPPMFSDNSFIFFAERIDGDYPKVNSSWRNMFFDDVFIPQADSVFKKVFHYQGNDYLLTAIKYSFYDSQSFPFSIDPTLTPSDSDVFFGEWGDLTGNDDYSIIEIKNGATVYVGAANCSDDAAPIGIESDCTWYVNVSGTFYIEDGSVLDGIGRGRYGADSDGSPDADGVGAGGDATGARAAGGGAGGFGAGGIGAAKGGFGVGGSAGSAYNTSVPGGWPSWAGSGGGAGIPENTAQENYGGDGGAGVYIEAYNITIGGRIDMSGNKGGQSTEANKGAGGGGSGGSIILRALNYLELQDEGSTATLVADGGDGGDQVTDGCNAPNDCTTGGGTGGGWIEIYYANLINLSGISTSAALGEGGLCIGSTTSCNYGANGSDGSVYVNQFNIAPNFTKTPFFSGGGIGVDAIFTVNLTSQIPLFASDYIKECNFSVWDSATHDMYINNTNATWAEDFTFNYSFMANVSKTYYWNITCYDNDGLTTDDDRRGIIPPINPGPYIPGDDEVPELVIDFPENGSTITMSSYDNTSLDFSLYTYDNGQINTLQYWLGGSDNQTITGNFSCLNKQSCSENGTIPLGVTADSTTELDVWFYIYDNNGTGSGPPEETTVSNVNATEHVVFTVIVPAVPIVSSDAGGGGGSAPIMAVVPFCGDGECQPEAGENIFNCHLDCATLSRLRTGELFKSALVVRYIVILIVILFALISVRAETYERIGRSFGRDYRSVVRRGRSGEYRLRESFSVFLRKKL